MKFRFPVRFSKSKSLLLQSLGEIHPIEPEKNDMMFRFSFYLSEYYSVQRKSVILRSSSPSNFVVFIVSFEQISHIALVFLLLTLKK